MILELLKEKTRANHSGIEKNELLSSLMSPELSVEMYLKVLEKFYGFFSPLEKNMAAEWSRLVFDEMIKARLKTPLLEKDLSYFGWSPEKIKSVPVCSSLPGLDSEGKRIGVLYVAEGSTLGGQMIVKALKSSLGITRESGGSFFDGYGPKTAVMWGETRRIIEDFSAEREDVQSEILLSAADTFEKLKKWFEKNRDGHE